MKRTGYSRYRFPPEIIQQAIWFYLRFTLSLRDVEDLLAEGRPPAARRCNDRGDAVRDMGGFETDNVAATDEDNDFRERLL
jgi:hypothetical protein